VDFFEYFTIKKKLTEILKNFFLEQPVLDSSKGNQRIH